MKAFITTVTLFIALCSAVPLSAFELTYALFLKTAGGEIKAADYRTGTARIQKGDRLKLYLQSDDCVYLYVILEDSNGDVALLFPASFSDCGGNQLLKKGQYLPDTVSWMLPIEDVNTKTFRIIASARRLVTFENLVRDYRKTIAKKSLAEQAEDARQAVIEEVRGFVIEASSLTRGVKTELRTVAVTLKGDERYEFAAEKTEADTLFVKTLTLTGEEEKR